MAETIVTLLLIPWQREAIIMVSISEHHSCYLIFFCSYLAGKKIAIGIYRVYQKTYRRKRKIAACIRNKNILSFRIKYRN